MQYSNSTRSGSRLMYAYAREPNWFIQLDRAAQSLDAGITSRYGSSDGGPACDWKPG
jgi:hypothetical protein